MLKKLVVSALFAGFAAGVVAAALQSFLVVPTLVQSELYEAGVLSHFGGPSEAGHADVSDGHATEDSHSHDGGGTFDRTLVTWFTTLTTFIGFALLMVAGFALAERTGHRVTARSGIVWGIAGFAAFHLAPAAGLPPELPGNAAGDLVGRQMWWAFTALATAGGLAAIAFGDNIGTWAAGIVAVALPHLIGAPHPAVFTGVAPPELASLFAARSLAVGLVTWAVLGALAAHYWTRET